MFASEVRLEFFRIENQGNEFVVTWHASVEDGVQKYVLNRKTSLNDQFQEAFEATPHGTSSDYEFRDNSVYKSAAEQLDYRLEVVYTSGAREVLSTKSINYTSTAVRRTWGSLKALFQ
jgi:hypothetical protein